jgi:aryl-alcohol dehydrogenase-like predicted oxidoreductase
MTTCPQCGGPQVDGMVRLRRSLVIALYAIGLLLAYSLGGQLLHDLAEGMDRAHLALWKAYVPTAALLLAVLATFVRRRRSVCARCAPAGLWERLPNAKAEQILSPDGKGRRVALRTIGAAGATVGAAAAGVGAAVLPNRGWLPVAHDFFMTEVELTAPQPRPEWKDAMIKSYRRLGRTDARVSDIALGGGRIGARGDDAVGFREAVDVARAAIDHGITYFDTAPDYSGNNSEHVLGEAMKGHRDKMFLATKFCVADGHLPNETPVPKIIEAVDASLKRLQTDHVDLIHVHSCDRVDRLLAPNIHEAFDRLKEQGKVRFMGVSTHTPNLEQVANAAIDSGRFDVMMLAYHFGMWPSFGHILEKAKQHDVGIVAMKTLKGAKHTNLSEFRDERTAYSQAAFKWVLSNPNVSCLVVSFFKPEQVEEYVAASGMAPKASEVALLERYDQLTRGDYCQPHCGICLGACPEQLAINDVLRHRMYFRDYGWEKEGMRLYAKLDRNAMLCADCPAPCTGSCPIGVPIREKMMDAHRLLTMA